jgi:transcriptional regulator with XRE-family HTH domain
MPMTAITPQVGPLRSYRIRAKMTQDDLARRSGYSPSEISRLESGQRAVSTTVAKRLAPILGLKSWWRLVPDDATVDDASGARSAGAAR